MSETVEKCATLVANYHGGNPRQYFAIRFYGECWTYDNPDDLRYDIFGKAYDCYRGNGGSSSNYVYQFASSGIYLDSFQNSLVSLPLQTCRYTEAITELKHEIFQS